MRVYEVANSDKSLPRVTFIDSSLSSEEVVFKDGFLVMGGQPRRCDTYREMVLDSVFNDHPIQSILYQWLRDEIEDSYDCSIS